MNTVIQMEVLVNYCSGLYSIDAPQRDRDKEREKEHTYTYNVTYHLVIVMRGSQVTDQD